MTYLIDHSKLSVMRILALLLLSALFTSLHSQVEPEKFIIRNTDVLTMEDGAKFQSDMDIIIEDGKIRDVLQTGTFDDPAYTVIDGMGMFVVPGISEMHAHIPVAKDGDDTYVRETLFLYLSNGITTIRGMLGDPYHLALRDQVRKGEILSPRIYTSSPSLNGNSVKSPEEAREKVSAYEADGYDFLKIHPGIKLDVMDELVKTAKEVNIRFAGHVPVEVGLERAIDYGYWSVDHCDGFVEAVATEAFDESEIGFFWIGVG